MPDRLSIAVPEPLTGALPRQDLVQAPHRGVVLGGQRAAPGSRPLADPPPRTLDELYPLPTRVPDELGSLIDAIIESTRRRPS